jgi:hypothetical protein
VLQEPKSIVSLRPDSSNFQTIMSISTMGNILTVYYQSDTTMHKKLARTMHYSKRSTDIPLSAARNGTDSPLFH